MNKTYELVELAKAKTGLASDYAIAQLINVSRMMVSHWKTERNEADTLNTVRLARAAGLDLEGLEKILEAGKENGLKKYKQGGFASVSFIFVTLLVCLALFYVVASPNDCILCKMKLKYKSKLLRLASKYRCQSLSIYLLKAY